MSNVLNDTRANNVKVLKEANKYLVFQCILKYAPLSIEDIMRQLDLSRPTVQRSVRELVDEGIIVKSGYSESNGGRSAMLFTLSGERHFALGIDFEFPTIRMAIANLKGETQCTHSYVYDECITKDILLEDFFRQVHTFIENSGIALDCIDGIGVGISGVIDTEKNEALSVERINGWKNVPLGSELEREIGIPVYLRNDVHLLGLVEKQIYMSDSQQDFIYVGIRSGIGSVVYQHNKAMRGEKGNAGFIGHATMDLNGPKCCCGRRGCLETYAGQLGIVQRYQERTGRQIPFKKIMNESLNGDKDAAYVVQMAGFYFGLAMANLVKIFEISNVVVGGAPELDNKIFIEAARQSMCDNIPDSINVNVNLSIGKLPEEKYALGGCYLVFHRIFNKPQLALTVV